MKNMIKTAGLILMLVGAAHCAENAGQSEPELKKQAFDWKS